MADKKKLLFYSILSSGHLNVCASLAKVLLDNHPDIEIWFIADQQWAQRLGRIDSRFKFGIVELNENFELKMASIVQKLEACLHMKPVDKLVHTWKMFIEDGSFYQVNFRSFSRKPLPTYLLICL